NRTIEIGKFDEAQLVEMKRSQNALLLLDSDGTSPGIDSLVVDFKSSVQKVIEHFVSHKAQHIAMLAVTEYTKKNHQRLKDPRMRAFPQVLAEKCYDEGLIIEADVSVESGYQAGKQSLKTNPHVPDALFAANDALAIGALKAIQEKVLVVQEDIY
uniref:substrate-binding domain-containing protein n=1 Tax=Enterococcus faecium TaxID=1352 RepID=UPI0030C84874